MAACWFKETECHYCHRRGHIAEVCRSKAKSQVNLPKRTQKHPKEYTQANTDDSSDEAIYNLFNVGRQKKGAKPIKVEVSLNNTSLDMEVNTGACYSIISEATYKGLWSSDQTPKWMPTHQKLRTYTGELLNVLDVTVQYQSHTMQLHAIVAAGSGPPLMGRDWLMNIRLDPHGQLPTVENI